MKFIKTIQIYFCLSIISIKSFCIIDPEGDKIPSVIPPSPDAASLGKYGEVPVSLYTGAINISIPLWEIRTNKLSVPIKLSYQDDGIKISERSGWIGEGWSLIANGVITRTVRGKIDEGEYGYFQYKEHLKISNYYSGDRHYELLKQIADGKIDCEPDIFHFNFGGYSGKFTFANQENKINITPFQNLKIFPQIDNLEITGFTIITPDGITYIFGGNNATEVTNPHTKYSENVIYNSGWYLTDIITPNKNDTIHFMYTSNSLTFNTFNQTCKCHLNNISKCETTPETCDALKNSWSIRNIDNCILKSIISRSSKVLFETTDRSDINNGKKLSIIKIFNYSDNVETDPPYKTFKLFYNYYGSADNDSHKRLFLSKLKEYGENNDSTKNPYFFTYHNPDLIPSRDSKQQDYWGYFNGATSNDSYGNNGILIPDTDYGNFHFEGADRDTDPEKVIYGMLCKIKYPTSGYDTLIFESHKVNSPESEYIYQEISHEYYASVTTCISGDGDTTFFTPEETVMGIITVKLPTYPPSSLVYAEILDSDSNEIIKTYNQQSDVETITDSMLFYMDKEYELRVITPTQCNGYPENFESRIEVNYTIINYDSIVDYNNKYVGGVRIKEIQSRNYDNKILTQKSYSYNKPDKPEKSSGNLFSKPRFFNAQKELYQDNYPCEHYTCNYLLRYSSSIVPLGTSGGSHVGYEYVTEKFDNNNKENGKIVYKFSHCTDFYGSTPIGNEWARGKLLSRKTYDKENTPVQEIINNYNIKEYHDNITKGFVVNYKLTNTDVLCEYYNEDIYEQNYYNIYSKWKYLKKTITRDYSIENPNEYIEKIKIYNYDFKNQQITRITEPQSNGDTLITKYLYPGDYKYSACINILDNCEDTLDANIQTCENNYNNCEDEYTENCYEYGDCYAKWVTCIYNALRSKACAHFFSPGNCQKKLNNCHDNYDNCANSIPPYHYNCTWKLNSCLEDAYYNYAICKCSYDSCVNSNYDISSTLLKQILKLQSNHISSEVIDAQKINKRSNNKYLVDGTITLYKDYSDIDSIENILPYKKLQVTTKGFVHNFSQSSIQNHKFDYDNQYYTEYLTFDDYDEYGNILQYTPKNDATISFLWGYNGIYPIAKAINANKNDISFNPETGQRECPEDAMMTTYKYNPVWGVIEITDENGFTMYYEYDNYGRLKIIRDNDENIIKQFKYNYGSE